MSRRNRFAQALLALSLCFGAFPAAAQDRFSGRVVDVPSGDSVVVRLDAWDVTVRLHGVDCPRDPPELWERARQYAARRVAKTRVTVLVYGTGTRQTVYGDVYPTTGGLLNEEMVRVGLATWAQAYAPRRTRLGELEEASRNAGRGLWGDSTGANVPLPPPAAVRLSPKPRATARPTHRSSPVPRRSAPSSGPTPPVKPASSGPPTPALPTSRHSVLWDALSRALPRRLNGDLREAVRQGATTVGGAVGVATLLLLLWTSRWNFRALPYQALVAGIAGAGAALLVPLPALLLWRRLTAHDPTLAVTGATLLAALCAGFAASLGRRDRLLRLAPRTAAAEDHDGFVRVTGETSAPLGVVYSVAGRIPALYVREITHRYEPHADGRFDRARRSLPHHWVKVYERTTTADFTVTDDSGSVDVSADRGEYYALRVARFYNDIPVETFFDTPYSGDTRTEVFFIPATATVTVWGRRYRDANPIPGEATERIGYDAARECLVVVEETPSRAYTGRWQVSLLLGLAAVVFAGLAAAFVVAPGALPLRIVSR